jgi:N utilization substance protein B
MARRTGDAAPAPSTGARPISPNPRRGSGRSRTPRVETRARARALQALYAWDVRRAAASGAGTVSLQRVAESVWDDLAVPADERRIANRLVAAVADQSASIDGVLADVTTNWRLERLGVIERSVLRLGAAELAVGETPSRVVIQEAVRLAERYGSAESAKFVNGVLDAFARYTGRL